MTRDLLICALGLLTLSHWVRADERQQAIPQLRFEIDKDGWGEAGQNDVRAILKSTSRELLSRFPGVKVEPLRIAPKGGPITLYQRTADGFIRVKLNTGDTYWSQYAYQFAHELCHILCQYREGDRSNQWFEETICETASLFVLRQMGTTWKTDAPYKNWQSYATKLTEYADKRIKESMLPEGTVLSKWLAENIATMRKNPEDRPKNTAVAIALLPLFEASPDSWAALNHLNEERPAAGETFPQYLQRWHDHTPAKHQPFVRKIADQLGVKLAAMEAPARN